MPHFIVNKNSQTDGYHEVHNETSGCAFLPNHENRLSIGNFNNCADALTYVRNNNPGALIDGCYYCANACHTR